jgi:hypothetical protein
MKKAMQVSKLDASKRQIETAIRLYFYSGDPISIHTLTAAGYRILHDINEARGGEKTFFKDVLIDTAKPEYRKMIIAKLNEAENFFKHADRDHDTLLEFNPEQTEMKLLDATNNYYKLTGEHTPLMHIYNTWFIAIHRNLFNLSPDQEKIYSSSASDVVSMGKRAYFELLLPQMMKI